MSVEPHGKTVLIIDDASITRAILRRIFIDHGFEVIEADSGERGVHLFQERRPNLVTMDIHMARLSGLGAIQVLLRIDPNARVLVVSSEHSPPVILEAIKIGAKGYVGKPFTPQTLMTAVEKALA